VKEETKQNFKSWYIAFIKSFLWIVVGILLTLSYINVGNVESPSDIIKIEDLEIWDEKVCIIGDYYFARVTDTKSMDPVMDGDSVLIVKKMENISEVQIGDIISFNTSTRFVVHRVIRKYPDYLETKGDNNIYMDSYQVTNNMINSLVVGILY